MPFTTKKWNLLFVLLFIAGLLLIEAWLRMNGIRPGFIYRGVEEVDSLEVLPCYFTDTFGIQKISTYGFSHINEYVSGKRKFSVEQVQQDKLENDLSSVAFDFYCLAEGLSGEQVEIMRNNLGIGNPPEQHLSNTKFYNESELRKTITDVRGKKKRTDFDNLLLEYISRPINPSGFRSFDFTARIENKKRILLLGDSHTWGRNAQPYFNSFADILLARGFMVFNSGIVSTDPVQYLQILQTYADSIMPDIVILNFFINDKMKFDHRPTETFHHTNAGLLSAYPHNVYLSASEAYNCELEESKIPLTNLFNKLCSATALTTQIWNTLASNNYVSTYNPKTENYKKSGKSDSVNPVCVKYLKEVRNFCTKKNIHCIISALPNIYSYSDRYSNISYQKLFDTIPYVEINSLTPSDYSSEPFDDHLTNTGHKKYADFLQHLIDSVSLQ